MSEKSELSDLFGTTSFGGGGGGGGGGSREQRGREIGAVTGGAVGRQMDRAADGRVSTVYSPSGGRTIEYRDRGTRSGYPQ